MHPKNVHGFKVGDRVLVVESNGIFYEGDILIFEDDDGSSCPYFKRESDGREAYCYYSRLGPVPVCRAKPKVGDKVRIIGTSSANSGQGYFYKLHQEGVVLSVDSSVAVRVNLSNYCLPLSAPWVGLEDLEVIPADPVAQAEAELEAAQAKLDAARKAEAEAKKIKPEDIKGGAVFLSAMGKARLVVGDYFYGFRIVCPESNFDCPDGGARRNAAETAYYMNHYGYTKTTKTLKDFI